MKRFASAILLLTFVTFFSTAALGSDPGGESAADVGVTSTVRTGVGVFAVLFLLAPQISMIADDPGENLSFAFVLKTLDHGEWRPADRQGAALVRYHVTPEGWPVALAFDYLGSSSEEKNTSDGAYSVIGYTEEFGAGLQKTLFETERFAGFAGGGLAFISAVEEVEDQTTYKIEKDRDDDSLGYWLNAGLTWKFGMSEDFGKEPPFILGLIARYSKSDVRLFGEKRDAGGISAGLSIGFGW
jgi:hypothetical protein